MDPDEPTKSRGFGFITFSTAEALAQVRAAKTAGKRPLGARRAQPAAHCARHRASHSLGEIGWNWFPDFVLESAPFNIICP